MRADPVILIEGSRTRYLPTQALAEIIVETPRQ
jgi:hypothetical protein